MTAYTDIAAIPRGRYSVILSDPPWAFATRGKNGGAKSAERHYATMKPGDIATLPVGSLAAPDCTLFLWTTWPHLVAAIGLAEAWGFEYASLAFIWIKSRRAVAWPESAGDLHFGTGYWTRANSEPRLRFKRGAPGLPARRDVSSVVVAPVREHSRKPSDVIERIESMTPRARRIELFSRESRPGWDCFGNEVGKFPALKVAA